jgi:hypothetical protein
MESGVFESHLMTCLLVADQQHDGFDLITMNMAVMDIATMEPLAAALPKIVSKNGR